MTKWLFWWETPGLLPVVDTGVNHYTRGAVGFYLPGENLAAFKWVKMKTTHPRNIVRPERESVLVCLKRL